jgi:transcriptional regulator with GAF, ATPase, and Fis domain
VEAGDGTLFLDELADLQPEVAGLLLRAIEECRIRPLGSDQEVAVRARVVAATNQPEKLRPDLLHRFLHRIVIPPLRERKEDIRAIARLVAFRDGFELTEKAIRVLGFASAWKGNGRELESLLFHASQRAAGRIVGGEHVIAELAAAWGGPRWSGNGDDSWLRAVREGLGLSLRELSGVVGVPKSTLEDMERGQDRARACEILERLARGIEALDAERPVPKGERGVKVRDELKRFLAEE